MQDIIHNLKRLKDIQPDQDFAQKSRMLILAMPAKTTAKQPFWYFVPIAAFVVIVIFSVAYLPHQTQSQASLDANSIKQEFNNLSINIELKEISYDQAASQTIASALSDIGNLESLNEDLKVSDPKINDLLNQVIF